VRNRYLNVLAVTVAATAALSGCGNGGTSGASGTGSEHHVYAFLMPCSTCADRFENQDKPLFEAAIQRIDPGAKVIATNAQGDSAAQISQTEAAIANGADVIVVSPLDESAGSAVSAKAQAAHVPVVSYDGLLTGAPIDYYVSFDNEKVGALQGQYLVDHLKAGSSVVMINGDQTIAPGRQFKEGAHTALDPLFESGKLKLAYESDTAQFDPAKAQASMEQALTKLGDKVDAVLAPNDGIAGAVINALAARHLAGKVLVTGQDATDAGLQRIVLGQQSMTVYKALKAEAEAAAKAAFALASGKTDELKSLSNGTTNNDAGDVPSQLLAPLAVTMDNIATTIFADGFTTADKVCTGDAAGKCPA
jgi:D-xylose transport system substrate-binding protein